MSEPSFVLDASIVLSWCFEDENDPYPVQVLDSFNQLSALSPGVWPLEVGNALVVAERRGRLDAADAVRFLELLRQLPISVELESPRRMFGEILNLAREHDLSTYDASYLDLAMRSGQPLATQDNALRQAALQCGVELYLVDA